MLERHFAGASAITLVAREVTIADGYLSIAG